MCGIAGILDTGKRLTVSQEQLSPMVRAIAHRGPDGEGYHVDRFMGLGHRRLAVIDPTPAGGQPMLTPDRRFALAYNGTIYNFRELRKELEAKGRVFKSQCDTEVLLLGWAQWGRAVVSRLNGHFAFCLWDAKQETLHLVRDRFGVKPLYYFRKGDLWLFASEIKSILAHPAYKKEINLEALHEYFTFQNQFRYHTLFKDIRLLPPANILSIAANGKPASRKIYWDYDFNHPDESMGFEDAADLVREALVTATRRQMVSDVPLGGYLSGGMDSGSIASIASRRMPKFNTFTCGWVMGEVDGVEADYDERLAAETMAVKFNTQHFEMVVGPKAISESLPKVINSLEDLRLGMSYGQWYVAGLASRFVKVGLSGTGGDELFGGYPWRYYRVTQSLNRNQFFEDYYTYWQRLTPAGMRDYFFSGELQKAVGQNGSMKKVMQGVFTFRDDFHYERPEDHVANSLYFESKTFLHSLLLIGDRLSMCHGLEERHPFLDNELVELAQKVPVRHKLGRLDPWARADENQLFRKRTHYRAYSDGKNVLREAMRPLLPKEVCERRKQGFSSPDGSWFRGPNLEFLHRMIGNGKALIPEFISRKAIDEAIAVHSSGKKNLRLLLWSLLCFEIWLRIFFNGSGLESEELNRP